MIQVIPDMAEEHRRKTNYAMLAWAEKDGERLHRCAKALLAKPSSNVVTDDYQTFRVGSEELFDWHWTLIGVVMG
jgi:hypothetical protein